MNALEKYKQTYDCFFTVYNKLKRLWSLSSRSNVVNSIAQEICHSRFVTPNQTRWNSEYDSLDDAYKKKENVSIIVCSVLLASKNLRCYYVAV